MSDYKLKNNEVTMVEPDLGTPRLELLVQLPNDGFIFPVEVNATSQMNVFRTEINRLQDAMGFNLPAVYSFIWHQNIVHEDDSFQAQGVQEGNLIKMSVAPAIQFY